MGKGAVIMVLGSISIFLMVNLNVNNKVTQATDSVVSHFSGIYSRNIANSAVELFLAKLGDDDSYRVSSESTMSLMNGTVSYRIVDTTMDSDDLIKIDVSAVFNEDTTRVIAFTKSAKVGFIPATVKAAITTNNPIKTLGSLIVDGREHDVNGNVIPNSGTLGIWTTQGFTRSGNSKIGGTDDGSDIAPSKPADPDTYEENESYPGGYPDTPDSILGGTAGGFPPGKLKSIAQSGKYGSQYTTNPSTLSYPLQGVTYVELASGGEWNSATITGSGILIVHNSANNAILKNSNVGPFTGLMIVDDIIHIHTDIVGAVVGLSPSPSEGNCIGNGSGTVSYSSEAITQATYSVAPTTEEYGFGRKRLSIVGWYE